MQIDYKLTKFILDKMKENELNYIDVEDIINAVIGLYNKIYNFVNEYKVKDLIIGHLYLLKDEKLIEVVSGSNLGAFYNSSTELLNFFKCRIRLTSNGYNFIKFLSFSEPLESLNNFTLNQVVKMSKIYL